MKAFGVSFLEDSISRLQLPSDSARGLQNHLVRKRRKNCRSQIIFVAVSLRVEDGKVAWSCSSQKRCDAGILAFSGTKAFLDMTRNCGASPFNTKLLRDSNL